MKKRKEI